MSNATAANGPWAVTEQQLQLMAEILAARVPLATASLAKWQDLGTLVVPAHEEQGVHCPEKRHLVRWRPVYGVVSFTLDPGSNGSAREMVKCVWEGSYFEPLTPLDPAHIAAEKARIVKADKDSADSWAAFNKRMDEKESRR